MRTPGRCTNLEGCWIGATQRDVWLSIGEDFACPNCGGTLTAPTRRTVSTKRLKKVAVTGVAVAMGVAAMAVAGVKISAIQWVAQPTVVAQRHTAGQVLALRAGDRRTALLDGTAAAPGAAPGSPGAARSGAPNPAGSAVVASGITPAAPVVPSGADNADGEDRPALTFVQSDPPKALARLAQGRADTSDAAALVFSDVPAGPGRRSGPRAAPGQQTGRGDTELASAPPPAMVTMLSEAAFVLPVMPERPVVLPISFGKPMSPEDDAPPISLRWRYHSLARTQMSYFLPATIGMDTLQKIAQNPALLR